MKGLVGCFQPAPSVFDIFIAFILIINFIPETYIKEIFFVFYTWFLLCLTFMFKAKRQYSNVWLGLLVLWSLVNVFIHSYFISQESITFKYKNMYLMSEGFIYIICGAIFLNIVVRYSKNIKFIYLLSPVLLMPWFFEFSKDHHLTPFVALFLSLIIYSVIKKRLWVSFLLLAPGLVYFYIKHTWVLSKFRFKIPMVKELVSQIIQHPFVGSGFNKTLNADNMVFLFKENLWLWKYNDFLNIGSQLGITALILCVLLAFKILNTMKSGVCFVLSLTLILIMSAQSIMFFVDKAVSYLLLTGMFVVNNYKKEAINVM